MSEPIHFHPSSLFPSHLACTLRSECIIRLLLLIMSSWLPGVDVSFTYLCSSFSFPSSCISCVLGCDSDVFLCVCVSDSEGCLRLPAVLMYGMEVVIVLDAVDPGLGGTAVMSVC